MVGKFNNPPPPFVQRTPSQAAQAEGCGFCTAISRHQRSCSAWPAAAECAWHLGSYPTTPIPCLALCLLLGETVWFREKRSHLALVRQSGRRPGQLWVVSSPRLRATSTRGWAQAFLAWAACSHSARNTAGQSHPQSTWCSGPDQNP